MDYIVLYFILTNDAGGYKPPLDVRPTDAIIQCGIAGKIVGLQVNRLENPTIALWPDPYVADSHCEVNIADKVASLEVGEYHLATTEMGNGSLIPYIGIDPHTSVYWFKSNFPMGSPTNLRLKGQ